VRRAARTDDNHAEIIKAFRKFGCSVADTHALGGGFPDAVVAKNYKTVLIEIKDGAKPLSARQLTIDEAKFYDKWQGLYFIVESLSDVIDVVRALER
jgi:hypothetical protein